MKKSMPSFSVPNGQFNMTAYCCTDGPAGDIPGCQEITTTSSIPTTEEIETKTTAKTTKYCVIF